MAAELVMELAEEWAWEEAKQSIETTEPLGQRREVLLFTRGREYE